MIDDNLSDMYRCENPKEKLGMESRYLPLKSWKISSFSYCVLRPL